MGGNTFAGGVSGVCCSGKVSNNSSHFGTTTMSQMYALKSGTEKRRLKSIVDDQALDIWALKDVLGKNGYGPR